MRTHFVFGDSHALPGKSTEYGTWIGNLLYDIRPAVVIDLGDTADMESLCLYEKGRAAFLGRSYKADIDIHNEFQDKVWHKYKKNKIKLPLRVRLIGNHEERIDRALQVQPELKGTIGYGDLMLDRYYEEVVSYNGNMPGIKRIDGVNYAHYFSSGAMGRAISSEHAGYTLLTKKFCSCTQGHSHRFSYSTKTTAEGKKIMGLVTPMSCPHKLEYAGHYNNAWDRGITICHNVEDGQYDIQYVRMPW